jgi:hypothetical protein
MTEPLHLSRHLMYFVLDTINAVGEHCSLHIISLVVLGCVIAQGLYATLVESRWPFSARGKSVFFNAVAKSGDYTASVVD